MPALPDLRLRRLLPVAFLLLAGCDLQPPASTPAGQILHPTPSEDITTTMASCQAHVESLPADALNRELAALQGVPQPPLLRLCQVLLLSQRKAPGDNVRIDDLLASVSTQPGSQDTPEARLARLFSAVHGAATLDTKRLEDQLDRQNQQLRDSQRKIELLNGKVDETTQKLDALRAIELSLPGPGSSGNTPAIPGITP